MSLNQILKETETRVYQADDSVCLERAWLVTEAFERHAGEPPPLLRAKAFRHILANMTLDMDSNPVFAGNTSVRPGAWMLVPEFGMGVDSQVALEHEELRGFLDGAIPAGLREYWEGAALTKACGDAGIGHMALDFDLVVNHGLESILGKLTTLKYEGDDRHHIYLNAMALACEAVIMWAERYAAVAESAAERAMRPDVAACHRRVAEACRQVPRKPARTYFEGLQAILLVHLASAIEGQGMSMSIGSPDRALARFAEEVAKSPGDAVDFTRGFLLGVGMNNFQGRGYKSQTITLGGADGTGRDCCNAITMAFLDAYDQTPAADPPMFLRWNRAVNRGVWEKSISMLSRGRSMPLLVNDEQVIPGLVEAGVSLKDATEYCIVGCNELAIPGRCCQSSQPGGLSFNDLEVLDRVMRSNADVVKSTQDILDAYEHEVERQAERGVSSRKDMNDILADAAPFPFCSACCRGCAEAGDDLLRAMPYPDIYGLFIRGTANAANALAAVEETVFGGQQMSLPDYLARTPRPVPALSSPTWGHDDDRADQWCVALNHARNHALRRVAARHGLPPFTVCHVVRSLHHLDGALMGPTADGRAAGEPLCDSIGAVSGTSSAGPTALLKSVLKLKASKWFTGIYNLNLTLSPGQAGPEVLQPLVEAFFMEGGQEIQVNVLDADELRRAQMAPERYNHLVVRIAGLSVRFTQLSRLEQEEMIQRAEAASVSSDFLIPA